MTCRQSCRNGTLDSLRTPHRSRCGNRDADVCTNAVDMAASQPADHAGQPIGQQHRQLKCAAECGPLTQAYCAMLHRGAWTRQSLGTNWRPANVRPTCSHGRCSRAKFDDKCHARRKNCAALARPNRGSKRLVRHIFRIPIEKLSTTHGITRRQFSDKCFMFVLSFVPHLARSFGKRPVRYQMNIRNIQSHVYRERCPNLRGKGACIPSRI